MTTSMSVFTPCQSSTSSLQTPAVLQVKLEPGMNDVTILSDDSNDNFPEQLPSSKNPCV